MNVDSTRFLYLPNSSPVEVEIVAQDKTTGKIISQVQAKEYKRKVCSSEKIHYSYINFDAST